MSRANTRVVKIGDRVIGGGNPILIQSMTNTKTEDVEATVKQIQALTEAGCDIIRCAVPTMEAAKALSEIKKQISIPLVADIHFDYRLAIAAIENGADKIRINPGNIGSRDRIQAVVDAAKERQIPIRVGVNSGSLEKELVEKYNGCQRLMALIRTSKSRLFFCSFQLSPAGMRSSVPGYEGNKAIRPHARWYSAVERRPSSRNCFPVSHLRLHNLPYYGS